jgi:hypothetical protein
MAATKTIAPQGFKPAKLIPYMSDTSLSSKAPVIPSHELRKERWVLTIVMLLGLLNGLTFVFIMPPWQHYEEPSHFEYAWLIASHQALPEYPAYDQGKRLEIAVSMIEHGFFKGMDFLPDLESQEPIWIGTNVTGSLPLYHILVALPLRLILNADIDVQLYTARFVSLVLYLATLWLAYKILGEFVPLGHPLRWIVPGAMVLLPGFTELMTAVNSDVGATFFFTLFLLASVILIQRGLSLWRITAVFLTAGLCLITKNTVLVALPLAFLAVILAMRRSRGWFAAWVIFLAALMIAVMSVFSWGDASVWYRNTMQEMPTQIRSSEAPFGNYAIRLETLPGSTEPNSVSQPLVSDQLRELKGKPVTIGAWIWASASTQAYLPAVSDGSPLILEQVEVDDHPSFHASQAMIIDNATRAWVVLQAAPAEGQNEAITIFYDGIVLLEGEWPLESAPVFDNSSAEEGKWGDRQFQNVVRNASAEKAGLFVRPWVEKLSKRIPWLAHLSPTLIVNAVLDLQSSTGIYRATVIRLYQTFWGYFGWGHIGLPSICYNILKWFTVFSFLIAPLGLWSLGRLKPKSWKLAMAWLGLAMLTIWLTVFMRGLPSLVGQIYIPTARYSYPAIVPTILILSIGWFVGLSRQRFLKWSVFLFMAGFLLLDLISIITIVNFYK